MPGTTPKGYPYALPADPLVQWPATSQTMAEKLDALALLGLKVWIGTGTSVTGGMFTVTFPVGTFATQPIVVGTPRGSGGVTQVIACHIETDAGATNKDKVTGHVRGQYTDGIVVNLIAIGT